MKVLITGAFGNLGLMCVRQALALGYTVRCFDIDNKKNREAASDFEKEFGDNVQCIFGDIRDTWLMPVLVENVEAIIHNASLLPPMTETSPDLAYDINVIACQHLIDAAAREFQSPVFIFPSSVTVFGVPESETSTRSVSDDIIATDNYTQHKIEIENYLETAGLRWVVLRVGVSVDARTLKTDLQTFKKLLSVKPNNPLEYVHPKDVAYAMCRAADEPKAFNKVLLIGGGKSCQITQYEFIRTAFNALGLRFPIRAHGKDDFYTHWMDTEESQKILQFQRYGFDTYRAEMKRKLRALRLLIMPFVRLLNPLAEMLLTRLVARA